MKWRSVKIILLVLSLVFINCYSGQTLTNVDSSLYAVAKMPTPVLNVPDFSGVFGGDDGKTLRRDKSGLIREVEFIALPGTVFTVNRIIRKRNSTIYKVTTRDYPYPSKKGYFVDSRFVEILDNWSPGRARRMPSQKTIINNLISSEGSIYIWGGNCREGVPELLSFYRPHGSLSSRLKDEWSLKGLDCSGLLYEATNGSTPRNTSSLIRYGDPVKIENLDAGAIIKRVAPLDLIVWNGHVIIVLDKSRIIESRLDYDKSKEGNDGGVRVRGLRTVLDRLLEERVPVNDYDDAGSKKRFVIRRWHSVNED